MRVWVLGWVVLEPHTKKKTKREKADPQATVATRVRRCPLMLKTSRLPANPFMAKITADGKCEWCARDAPRQLTAVGWSPHSSIMDGQILLMGRGQPSPRFGDSLSLHAPRQEG